MNVDQIRMIRWIYDHTPCNEEKDCAHFSSFISTRLEQIKGIRVDALRIDECPSALKNHDILILNLPSLFSHFHYMTIVYENKALYLFQNYGRYEIPMTRKTVAFFTMVKDYLFILGNARSDEDMTTLLSYEADMYGLNPTQMDELLFKKEMRYALRLINPSLPQEEQERITEQMEKQIDIETIVSSFLSSVTDIYSWVLSFPIPIELGIKTEPQKDFFREQLLFLLKDMYTDEPYHTLFQTRQAKFFYSEMNIRERQSITITRYQLPLHSKRLSYRKKTPRHVSYRKNKI